MTCRRCPNTPEPGRKLCEPCLADGRLRFKLRAADHAARGLCQRCTEPSDGGTLCPHHRAQSRARYVPTGARIGRRPDPRCDQYAEKFRAGLPVAAIAQAVNRSRSAVEGVLRHRGLLPPVPSEQRRRRAA